MAVLQTRLVKSFEFFNVNSKVSDLPNQTEVLNSFPGDANNYSHLGITDLRLFKYQRMVSDND